MIELIAITFAAGMPTLVLLSIGFFGGGLGLILGVPAALGAYWTTVDLIGLPQLADSNSPTWTVAAPLLAGAISVSWGLVAIIVGLIALSMLTPPLGTALPDNH